MRASAQFRTAPADDAGPASTASAAAETAGPITPVPAARTGGAVADAPGSPARPDAVVLAGPACSGLVPTAGARPRALRADATRNRAAILSAAREAFAELGLQAPLEEIARRADVGIATLYRRFPTRERLVAAALVEKISLYADAARLALAEPDPWDGFAGLVRRICELQASDRGLSDLLSMTLPASEDVEILRSQASAHVAELIDRAKAAGRLRPDFAAEDLLLLLVANAAVARITRADAPEAWRRFLALILDAFQYTGGEALPAPPSKAEMTRAMARLARDRGCGAGTAGAGAG